MAAIDDNLTPEELARDYTMTSRMNEIYYADQISTWKFWDLAFKIVSGIASSAAVVLFLKQWPHGTTIAACLSAAAAIATIISTVLGINERIRVFGVLCAEYAAHFAVFSRLKRFGCTLEEVEATIAGFDETAHRQAKDDPTTSKRKLASAYNKVLVENGMPVS